MPHREYVSLVGEDIEFNTSSSKFTAKTFVQTESLELNDMRQAHILEPEHLIPLIVTGAAGPIELMKPIGFVVVPKRGLGELSKTHAGYWIVLKKGDRLYKFKAAGCQNEFTRNMGLIPDWDNLQQIFI